MGGEKRFLQQTRFSLSITLSQTTPHIHLSTPPIIAPMLADLSQPAPPKPTKAEVDAWRQEIFDGVTFNAKENALSTYLDVRMNLINGIKMNMDKKIATEGELELMAQMEKDIAPYKKDYLIIKGARDLQKSMSNL